MAESTGPWLVFAFETYYPSGGWGDFVSGHSTLEDAEAGAAAARAHVAPGANPADWLRYDYVQIVDVAERKIVRGWELGRRRVPGTQGKEWTQVWDEDTDDDG